jgi:hypothetical protein
MSDNKEKEFDWEAFKKEQAARNEKAKRERDERNRKLSDATKRKK